MKTEIIDENTLPYQNRPRETTRIILPNSENLIPFPNQLDWPRQTSLQAPHGRYHDPVLAVEHRDDNNVPNKKIKRKIFESLVPAQGHKPNVPGSITRDWSRAPLKKRPTTPVPPPPRPLSTQTSSGHRFMPGAPFLRQCSSTFSMYNHPDFLSPQLCMTSSRGQQLISEPLFETPKAATLPWSRPSSTNQVSIATKTPVNVSAGFFCYTPGLDMLAQQVMNERPALLKRDTNTMSHVTAPAMATKRIPPTEVSHASTPQLGSFTPIPRQFELHSLSFPFGPRDLVVPERTSVYYSQVVPGTDAKESLPNNSPANNLEVLENHLFTHVPMTNRPCKCLSSRCLKLYCECFHSGLLCDSKLCRCKDCHNSEEHCQPRGDREIAIKRVLARRPDAFRVKVKKRTGNGCGCKKSK
jgi:hypothetical protein